jgi:hypothetical protein
MEQIRSGMSAVARRSFIGVLPEFFGPGLICTGVRLNHTFDRQSTAESVTSLSDELKGEAEYSRQIGAEVT